jgi:hypothetical protein
VVREILISPFFLALCLLVYLVDTEKQPDEARNGACVAIRDQDIAR